MTALVDATYADLGAALTAAEAFSFAGMVFGPE
jgi:hypothetical protein